MKQPTAEQIIAAMKRFSYVVFEDPQGYDLNLFGIRATDTKPNRFDDTVGVLYWFAGRWNLFCFPATTDPGAYWREHPMNVDGTAILVPGQYRGAFKVGVHKDYGALQQLSPLKVYRDNDRDAVLDLDPATIQEGKFGINLHRAGQTNPSTQVDKWSAGCQVLQDPIQFDFLLNLCKRSANIYGNSFTYTLLDEKDLA